jgi:hypothetical protein
MAPFLPQLKIDQPIVAIAVRLQRTDVELEKSDDKGAFTATQIGNDQDGNLVDKTTGKGEYTGRFDGKGVTLADSQGGASAAVWLQGSASTSGIQGSDALDHFDFTFHDHNAQQTLNADWTFHGSAQAAAAALEKADSFTGGWEFILDTLNIVCQMKVIGIGGVLLLLVVAVMSVSLQMLSPNTALFLLTASLGGAGLGAVAAIRGSKWWLAETIIGLLMAAFVLFGLVGS